MIRAVGQLGLPQALQTHIFFPVQIEDIGIFQTQIPGEFPVDGGICPVVALRSLLKMNIKSV